MTETSASAMPKPSRQPMRSCSATIATGMLTSGYNPASGAITDAPVVEINRHINKCVNIDAVIAALLLKMEIGRAHV